MMVILAARTVFSISSRIAASPPGSIRLSFTPPTRTPDHRKTEEVPCSPSTCASTLCGFTCSRSAR